jgi:hypothetical protein
MFAKLLQLAAANNLVTGLRVGPLVSGRYQIHIWVGPKVGDRYEWFERFDPTTPHEEAIDAVADRALIYCVEHWHVRLASDEATAA